MALSSIVIFTGGSAWNPFTNAVASSTLSSNVNIVYVIPVSDDGGSTHELVRVLGGPGIGDLRSRIVRLARSDTPQDKAVLHLLSHRLDSTSLPKAIREWEDILHKRHALWSPDISPPYKDTILAFLSFFQNSLNERLLEQYQQQQQNPLSVSASSSHTFDFRHGSIGNFLLTGCRLFFKSLDAALFQLARLLGCPDHTLVIPVTQKLGEKKERRRRASSVVNNFKKNVVGSKTQSHHRHHHHNRSNTNNNIVAAASATTTPNSSTLSLSNTQLSPTPVPNNESSFSGSSSSSAIPSPYRTTAITSASTSSASKHGPVCDYEDAAAWGLPPLERTKTVVAAWLRNGDRIIGQCNISHPGAMVSESASVIRKMSLSDRRAPSVSSSLSALAAAPVQGKSAESGSRPLSATSPNVPPPPPPPQLLSRGGSHSQLHDVASSPSNSPSSTTNIPSATNNNNLFFSKSSTHTPPLPSPIRRIAYINHGGMESLPTLNPLIPPHLSNARAVIYGLGSLYTSLIPSLIVAGIGDHIAVQNTRIDGGEEEDEVVKCVKVLVLNGCNDRETTGYSAMDFVLAVTDALNYSCWAQRRLDMKSATSGVQDDLKRGQSQQHNNTCTNYRTTGTMNDVELLGLDLDAGIADMKVSNGGAGGGQGFILQQPDHQSVSPDHQHQHQTAISPLPVQDVKKDEGENGHIEDNDIDRYIDLEEPDSAVLVEEEVGEPWDCLSMHYTNPSNLPIPPTPPHPSLRYMRASSSSLSLSTIQSATSSALVSNSPSPFLAAQSTSAANRSAYTPPTLNTGSPSSSSSSSPLLLSSSMAAHANPLIMQSETGLSYICSPHPPSAYITHLVYLSAGQIPVDEARIRDLGITCIKVEGDGTNMYRAEDISQALSQVFNK